jgi:Protein of unknown function (DUF3180)
VTGRIQPTRIRALVAIAVVTGAVAWSAVLLWDDREGSVPTVPWTAPLVLGFLAAVVGAFAWVLHSRFAAVRARDPDARPVDPLAAARALGIAKASALVGALVAGLYAGVGLYFARDLDVEVRRERAVVCLVAVVAALALVAAGLWLERVLRVPPDEHDEHGRPDDAGPTHMPSH